ncbi:MAG: class I SAM-dependent methyltransferase [Gammaproteobacteria bacterium]|nr:class I SAM-dependent methyltransferase [Gammaproteobacteria bacterium]
MTEKTTHFGYQEVPEGEKRGRVAEVFDSVSSNYDVMNDLMSMGLHRVWKRFVIEVAGLRRGMRVLDLAGGTGDLSTLALPRVGSSGEVTLLDINQSMVAQARRRLLDLGVGHRIRYAIGDAEALPFADNSFDCVMMAFGLRNVTHKDRALESIRRILRPGGKALILEFSTVKYAALKPIYDKYSFSVLPWLGSKVAGDADSYRYLAESIRMHPDQEAMLEMMGSAGFERLKCFDLTGGIVAVHRGYKL